MRRLAAVPAVLLMLIAVPLHLWSDTSHSDRSVTFFKIDSHEPAMTSSYSGLPRNTLYESVPANGPRIDDTVASFVTRRYIENYYTMYDELPRDGWFLLIHHIEELPESRTPDFIGNVVAMFHELINDMPDNLARIDLRIPPGHLHIYTDTWREIHRVPRILTGNRDDETTEASFSVYPEAGHTFSRITVPLSTWFWGFSLKVPKNPGSPFLETDLDIVLTTDSGAFMPTEPKWYQPAIALDTGDVLTRETIRKSVLVTRGEQVIVEFKKGSAVVELDGVATTAAGIDDAVNVQISISGKRVTGMVSGPRRVYVVL